ncbi:MAG: hypothetical protein LBD67_02045 [Candidatus Accumulibacter sp.]|nr:hypothetical protein [Accumulibacter sp.]
MQGQAGFSRHSPCSVLSLSKYERTLHLSSPYPSTSSGRTDWKGILQTSGFWV